jgi:lysophospholipid acyltransferase (LPLAT)-like uncharacterized protein
MSRKYKNTLDELKWNLVGLFGKWFIDILFMGSRIDYIGLEKIRSLIDSRKIIYTFWHSRILLISYIYKGLNAVTLVSKSDDGEIIARILHRQGQFSVRGSTGKGGLRALAQQIKLLKTTGNPGAVIPDGPQGPCCKVQPGVITLAQKTGFAIVPITYSARQVKVFNSWDRFILPRPLTRCRVIYGEPIHIRSDADAAAQEHSRKFLETELCRITTEADNFFGHHIY